jgi:hypothetical protein
MINHSRKLILITIAFCFALTSCEYSPTGSNFQQKEIPEPILLVDLNASADTISVWGRATLTYNLDLLGRTFYEGEFLLEDEQIHTFNQPSGSYSFSTNAYLQDTLSLVINGYSSTGSNSLADIAGIEFLFFEREYTLIIDNRPPESLSIVDISSETGELVITWKKFEGNGFVRYNIEKGWPQPGGHIDEDYLSGSFDINQTSIVDSTYLGGPAFYRVNIISELGSAEGVYQLHDEPKPQFQPSPDTHYTGIPLKWSSCRYPQNFAEYNIQVDNETIFSTDSITDTSFYDTGAWFGDPIEYTLEVKLKNNSVWIHNSHDTIEAFIGEPFPYPGRLQFCGGNSSIYRQLGTTIYRQDVETYEYLDSINVDSDSRYLCFGISPDGQNAFLMSYENDTGYLYRVDPLNLDILQTWTTSSLLGYNGRARENLSISNGNTLVFPSYRDNNNTNWGMGVVLLDMNDPIEVINPNYSYATSAEISADGAYLLAYDSLYTLVNGVPRGQVNLGSGSESMFIDDGHKFLVATDENINIYNTLDRTLISQIVVPEELRSLSYDPTSGHLGGLLRSSNSYMIYNPLTGMTVGNLKTSSWGSYKLWNYIIYTSGYILPLQELEP